MSRRTLWEEGHEPGRQVVALGLAVALTAVVLDVWATDSVSVLFDVCFVLLCVTLALAVRPTDAFTVGVLPPLLMVVVFVLLGATRPDTIADPGDGVIQAVVSGLSHHATALVLGYGLCLGCLAVRHRVAARTSSGPGTRMPPPYDLPRGQAASKREGSPAPTRSTSG